MRYLGFFFLISSTGLLLAQVSTPGCLVPKLDNGYFGSEKDTYLLGDKIIYACDKGYKPVAEGWWATSTCQQDGSWSDPPQCTDEKNCLPPIIPNGNYSQTENDLYEDGKGIRVTCDKGYRDKNHLATAYCRNGNWTTLPACERDRQACSAPPKALNAVIIHQTYKDVFPVNSAVKYLCEAGYTFEKEDTDSVYCIAGQWTPAPTCMSIHQCSEPPEVPHASIKNKDQGNLFVADSEVEYECEDGYAIEGGADKKYIYCIQGAWTEAPTCKVGSSVKDATPTNGPNGGGVAGTGSGVRASGDGKQPTVRISACGRIPVISNGDVLETTETFVTFQCKSFYKLVGPEKVVCHSNGRWSEVPTCEEDYCVVNAAKYPHIKIEGKKYLLEGEREKYECVKKPSWWFSRYSVGVCHDGRVFFGKCCNNVQRGLNQC